MVTHCPQCGGSGKVKKPRESGSGWSYRMDRDPYKMWPSATKAWVDAFWASLLVASCSCQKDKTAMTDEESQTPQEPLWCPVCGLKASQLPPTWRFAAASGDLVCRHPFGIPAKDIPDWRTHDMDGRPYKVEQ